MWFNAILESAIVANLLAQLMKVPLHYFKHKKWDLSVLISTGGMPSSHTAFVTSLTAAVAFHMGVGSVYFAIAFCLAAVVIHDAMGIRRHAGKNAALLNKLIADLKERPNLVRKLSEPEYQKELKELLGHEPVETFWGLIFGVLVAVIYFQLVG